MSIVTPATVAACTKWCTPSVIRRDDSHSTSAYIARRPRVRPCWMCSLMVDSARRSRRWTVASVRPVSSAIARLE
jgi:hypothetical protein